MFGFFYQFMFNVLPDAMKQYAKARVGTRNPSWIDIPTRQKWEQSQQRMSEQNNENRVVGCLKKCRVTCLFYPQILVW